MTLQRVASYLPKTATDRAIKYTVEYHRKDGVSEEAFTHWFANHFLPRAVPIMEKHNILKYTVQKTDRKVGAAFHAEVDQLRLSWKLNDCDLMLEYWVYDLESMKSLTSDPEWIQMALQDENDWLDTSKSTIHVGYDMTDLGYGTIVNVERRKRSRVSASFD